MGWCGPLPAAPSARLPPGVRGTMGATSSYFLLHILKIGKFFAFPGRTSPNSQDFKVVLPRGKNSEFPKKVLPSFPPSLPRCIELSKFQNFQIVLAIFEMSKCATQNQYVHIKFNFSKFQKLFWGLIPEPTTI